MSTTDAPASLDTASAEERAVIALLQSGKTYQQIADEIGRSRGFVYQIALMFGVRKHERAIRERREERKRAAIAFMNENMNTTVQADALDFLRYIPDGSVDLHVTSPPYNVSKSYIGGVGADAMDHLFYLGWQVQIISEIARTLKPGGTVVYQIGLTIDDDGERFPLDELLSPFFRKAKLTFQNRIVWPAQNGLTPKSRLAERYETALVYSKGEQSRWNPNSIRTPQKQPSKRAFKGPNVGRLSGNPLGSYPSDIWDITRIMHNHPEKTGHPAQFPIEFARRAILAYTLPGDTVADIFSGSGSTQAACIRTGRNFIGSDIGYAAMRADRLAKETIDRVTPFSGVTKESMAVWGAEPLEKILPLSSWDPAKRRISTTPPPITKEQDAELCLDLFSHQAS